MGLKSRTEHQQLVVLKKINSKINISKVPNIYHGNKQLLFMSSNYIIICIFFYYLKFSV